MIWVHGLFLSLWALAAALAARLRHLPQDGLLTGLCLGAAWISVRPGTGRGLCTPGALSGLALALCTLPYAPPARRLWHRLRSLRLPPLQARASLETLPYAIALGVGSAIALLEPWA